MVDTNIFQLNYSWFNIAPVHPTITSLDKEIMLTAISTALKITLNELKKIDDFKHSSPHYETTTDLFNAIETMLEDEITPTTRSQKDIYTIKDFPCANISKDLIIYNEGHVVGPGNISIKKGTWTDTINQETLKSIPNDTIQSLKKEFELLYNPQLNSNQYKFMTNYNTPGKKYRWEIKNAQGEAQRFAENLTFAYTNEILKIKEI